MTELGVSQECKIGLTLKSWLMQSIIVINCKSKHTTIRGDAERAFEQI